MTGLADAEAAACHILQRPNALTEWCIIKLGSQGALLCSKAPLQRLQAPAFQVVLPMAYRVSKTLLQQLFLLAMKSESGPLLIIEEGIEARSR